MHHLQTPTSQVLSTNEKIAILLSSKRGFTKMPLRIWDSSQCHSSVGLCRNAINFHFRTTNYFVLSLLCLLTKIPPIESNQVGAHTSRKSAWEQLTSDKRGGTVAVERWASNRVAREEEYWHGGGVRRGAAVARRDGGRGRPREEERQRQGGPGPTLAPRPLLLLE